MDDELTLDRPYMLGLQVAYLSRQPVLAYTFIFNTVDQLLRLSKLCGVPTGAFGALLAKVAPWTIQPGHINSADLVDIHGNAASISGQLVTELQKTRVVRLLDANVSGMLRTLNQDLTLSKTQVTLRNETIRCLECGAFRSAIVMGWNTIYDYLRTWIIADPSRLTDCNIRLARIKSKKGAQKFQPVATYPELRDLKLQERDFLGIVRQLSGVNGDSIDHLVISLNKRNKYAHATNAPITMHVANAYIEDLIILAQQEFKHDAKAVAP